MAERSQWSEVTNGEKEPGENRVHTALDPVVIAAITHPLSTKALTPMTSGVDLIGAV
jgi:hypothetical protein